MDHLSEAQIQRIFEEFGLGTDELRAQFKRFEQLPAADEEEFVLVDAAPVREDENAKLA